MKEAKTQKEFEELSKLGDWVYVTSGSWMAREQSHVEAWGQSHVVAWEQSHVVAISPHVSILAKSKDAMLTGGYILGDKVLTAKEWLSACSVKIKNGKVILYKRIGEDWVSQKDVSYKVGEITAAPDWDATSKEECGRGLHFCPTVAQTIRFRDNGIFIACEVDVKDIASLPAFAEYPDKIRARACKVLYQVDEEGNKIEKEVTK